VAASVEHSQLDAVAGLVGCCSPCARQQLRQMRTIWTQPRLQACFGVGLVYPCSCAHAAVGQYCTRNACTRAALHVECMHMLPLGASAAHLPTH
jgi:hypothetical protein